MLKFNHMFKALRAGGVARPEALIQAVWVNLAISFRGLKTLGLKAGDLRKFPTAFKDGMKKRAARLGDAGASDPQNWVAPYGSPDLHAVLIVAADDPGDLTRRVDDITQTPAFRGGVEVLGTEDGNTRADQRGHEHFGFKDGVSQPGIRGLTPPDDPIGNPHQGHPGQDLLWPGEFVLGYPTQKSKAKKGFDGPNPDPGKPSRSGPAWTADGSYLVFRRLGQDVPGFRKQVQDLATRLKSHRDLVGAKLVGRYASGCPLEERAFQPGPFTPSPTDPGEAKKGGNAALADSDSLNNDFEFADDPDGAICPLGAHIRKAYPRDERTPPISQEDSESATQTHRLLRRGIPFGNSFGAPRGGGANDPRGLLFLAYQSDIERQFEFVQRLWVNNAAFPAFPKGTAPRRGSDHRAVARRTVPDRPEESEADPGAALRHDQRRGVLLRSVARGAGADRRQPDLGRPPARSKGRQLLDDERRRRPCPRAICRFRAGSRSRTRVAASPSPTCPAPGGRISWSSWWTTRRARIAACSASAATSIRPGTRRGDGPPWIDVPDWFSWDNQGASVAVADIDGDGRQDLVVFMVDSPPGQNAGLYRVGKALDVDGNVTGGWGPWIPIPDWFSFENQHCAVTLADLDADGTLELIVLMVDNPPQKNRGLYRIGRSSMPTGR